MLNVHFSILFTITYLCVGQSAELPPLFQLANVVKGFKTAELCTHMCETNVRIDENKIVRISFKTDRKPAETADDLCNCMFEYINQENWLVDPGFECLFDRKTLTLTIFGTPTELTLSDINAPVAALAAVLKKFPTADLSGHKCMSSSTLDKDGLTHLLLQCELTCDSPPPQDVCKNIMGYLDQSGWLNSPKTTCTSKRFDLSLTIVGK